MLTIFAVPKSFRGHERVIQTNALLSWLNLRPACQVILFGDEDGISEVADRYGTLWVPQIEKNDLNVPLVRPVFTKAQELAQHNILVYANADIIFTSNLISAIQPLAMPSFLLCGRRWDLDVNGGVDFASPHCETKLLRDLKERGKLHGPSGIDYFVFPKGLFKDFPEFVVGRPGWDNWLIYHARRTNIPVIDATGAVTAIHQNHRIIYSHQGVEAKVSKTLAGGVKCRFTIREADWELVGRKVQQTAARWIYAKFSMFLGWRLFLSCLRILRMRFQT